MQVTKLFILALFLSLGAALMLAAPSTAQQPTPQFPSDDDVNAIAKHLYCPVCENIPLDVCPTQACEQWRQLVREKLAEGLSEAEIKQFFVDQYGDRVLGAPPAKGFNWLVYLVPPLALLGGSLVLLRAFRTWKQPSHQMASGSSAANQPVDEYVARIEEELRKR